MTKRLQVLLEDPEYGALQQAASARGISVAEWVRQALAAAHRLESTGDAIRAAVRHAGPTGPVERLTADIERSYLTGVGPDVSSGSY
jgi:hypothetical protein